MTVHRGALLVATVLSVCTFVPAHATTECTFAGPTPGWKAVKLDLPTGSSFLTLQLLGTRTEPTARPVADDNSWHLAQGIFVINAASGALEAFRLDSQGMAPRRIVLRNDGQSFAEQNVVAPDVRYEHQASRLRPDLPAGSYYVIAFGVDGGGTFPNEFWNAGVHVDGTHSCAPIGTGEVFEADQTDFRGGTQVHAPGFGMGEGLTHSFGTGRALVVGLMEAQTQARPVGSATLDFTTPTESGRVSQGLRAFVSTAGAYTFEANYRGAYPLTMVAGVALDLS